MEQQTDKNEDKSEDLSTEVEKVISEEAENAGKGASTGTDSSGSENEHTPSIHPPSFIHRYGLWPINIGLFFFYSNVVSLFVLIVGLTIMMTTGVTEESVIMEKLGGLSVISNIITLGLTLMYSKKFYFRRY